MRTLWCADPPSGVMPHWLERLMVAVGELIRAAIVDEVPETRDRAGICGAHVRAPRCVGGSGEVCQMNLSGRAVWNIGHGLTLQTNHIPRCHESSLLSVSQVCPQSVWACGLMWHAALR